MSVTPERIPRRRTVVAPQPQLKVGAAGDQLERDADEIAHRVVGADATSAVMSRQCSGGCAHHTPERHPGVSGGIASLRGGGRSLTTSERAFFEPRFGYDFGSVRLHTGSKAAGIAHDLNARAFTAGSDIAFEQGGLEPGTRRGMRLLGHELAHVVQQGAAGQQGRRGMSTASAVPSVQLQTTGQPCGQQSIVDGAFETAKHLTQLALIRVGRVKGIGISPGISNDDEEMSAYRSTMLDTFGDTSITSLDRVERELGAIQAKLGSRPNQLCAAASAWGCARNFVAYVDKAVADTIFYCPAFFDPVQSPNERALKTIHEVAHVLGKQHGGFSYDDESMIHACGFGLGINFSDALDNAYAYETLVGCLTGTRAQVQGSDELTKKEMRKAKKAQRQP